MRSNLVFDEMRNNNEKKQTQHTRRLPEGFMDGILYCLMFVMFE